MKKQQSEKKSRALVKNFNQSHYLDKLLGYHSMFYAVFELGFPIHTDQVDTAAIGYNSEENKINFLINPDFFYNLGEQEQLFVICHEASHVIFSHIDRIQRYELDVRTSNIAQDIVINEMLVREFGFSRDSLRFPKELCFIDTVFKEEHIEKDGIIYGKSFEFYYEKLLKHKKELKIQAESLDIHIKVNNDGSGKIVVGDKVVGEIPKEISQHIYKQVKYKLSSDELKEFSEKMTRSGIGGGQSVSLSIEEKKEKPWQLLINNKIATLQKLKEQSNDTFRVRPRRIVNLSKELYLPEVLDGDELSNEKFNAFFFVDASGSCSAHVGKFFNLIRTVPEKFFHSHAFSFDTDTYPLDIKKNKVVGGGGTSFFAIEERVRGEIATNKLLKGKHPDLVFVLTDGYGDAVHPEKPERWYFMLTENHLGSLPVNSNYAFIKEFKQGNNKVYKKTLKNKL